MENRLFFSHLLFFLMLSLTTSVWAEQREIKLAYLENGLSELNNNEKQVALQMLANELVSDSGMLITIHPVATLPEIQGLIAEGHVDYVIFNSYHYIHQYDFLQSHFVTPIWAIQRGPQDRENFILVANKRYANQELKSFRGKTLSSHRQYLLMNFYLEFLIKQTSSLDSSRFFKKIKHTKTASQAVLDVYFGVSDLCIVPKHIFDLTVELNPSILQKLTIMHQSGEQFLPVLSFSFNHVDSSIRNLINENLSMLNETVRGKQILDMFNIQAIKSVKQEQLQPMRTLYRNYQTLQYK